MRRGALLLLAAMLAGCGNEEAPLKVAAASSLKAALTGYAREDVSLAFAGSDQLAAQIRQGARPDVFVAANPKLPEELQADGLVQAPVVFAGNRLVLAVPAADARKVGSLADLERPGVKLAIAGEGVPVGDYAREVLTPAAARNVRSEEPDVAGVVGKIAQGAVDAGFVYATDVKASNGRLIEIPIPGAPQVRYAAAVVRRSARATEFVAGLRAAPALRDAGFTAP